MPYVLPFILYVVLTQAAAYSEGWYPLLYGGVVIVVGIATVLCLRRERMLHVHGRVGIGVLAGLIGIVLWILLATPRWELALVEYLPAWLSPQERAAFNPFAELAPAAAWAFVAVRLVGLALLVPVVEELFWRGFLARWLVDQDWRGVPIGRFTPASFAIVTLLFTLAHPEWLAAAAYCALLNGLLWWRRDLWECVVAHATSNLVLGIYVLTAEQWWLW